MWPGRTKSSLHSGKELLQSLLHYCQPVQEDHHTLVEGKTFSFSSLSFSLLTLYVPANIICSACGVFLDDFYYELIISHMRGYAPCGVGGTSAVVNISCSLPGGLF